ncbi:biotin/lipoyl-binding protein, partial [Psychrobacter sp. TB47]|uniref:efflux RND transporter periplasmic adaptor subunit n=1 Tax=Psychrobacter sp. TB47 TaxID=985259 RepID=UPI00046E9CA7
MSDLEETNPKLSPESELPPYRQADTLGNKPSSKMPLWLLPVLGIVLVIGVLLGKYWGAGDEALSDGSPTSASTQNDGKNPSDASTEQSVLSVETVMPSQDTIGNTLSADGTISAKDVANVSAKVNGVAIERVLVEEGERVKAGQVLAIFDTDAMEQQVVQAEAADAARVLPLIEIDAISRQEADRYRTSKLQAEAALQASKARLSTQRLSVKNANVLAPVSGVISEKMAEVGMVAG